MGAEVSLGLDRVASVAVGANTAGQVRDPGRRAVVERRRAGVNEIPIPVWFSAKGKSNLDAVTDGRGWKVDRNPQIEKMPGERRKKGR